MDKMLLLSVLSLQCVNSIRTESMDLLNMTETDGTNRKSGKKWITKYVAKYCSGGEDERLELTANLPKGTASSGEGEGDAADAVETFFTLVTVEDCGNLALANEECGDWIYTNVENKVDGKGCPADKCKCRCLKKGKTCHLTEQSRFGDKDLIVYAYEEEPVKLNTGDVCEGGPRGSGFDERCPPAHACCRKGYRSNCIAGGCDVAQCDTANIVSDYAWTNTDKHECVPLKPTALVVPNENPLAVMPIARTGKQTVKLRQNGKRGPDLSPTDFPKNLLGMIWMDQIGYFSYSQVPTGNAAPDALVCFGDDHFPLREVKGDGTAEIQGANGDTETIELRRGRISVKTDGPCWTWFNDGRGLAKARYLKNSFGYQYEFYWTTDPTLPYPPYNHAKIYPHWDRFNKWAPTAGLLQAFMYTQKVHDWCSKCVVTNSETGVSAYVDPPTAEQEKTCGCQEGSGCTHDDDGEQEETRNGLEFKRPNLKAEILADDAPINCKCHNKPMISHQCAKWARQTVIGATGVNAYTIMFYYAFEIMDGDGNKVEPGWTKYLEWTNKVSTPDLGIAFKHGWFADTSDGKPDFSTPNTQFVGLRDDGAPPTGLA